MTVTEYNNGINSNFTYPTIQSGTSTSSSTKETSSRNDFLQELQVKQAEMKDRIKNGNNDPKFQIGGQVFTEKEWKNLIKKIDKNIDVIKEEQKERLETQKQQQMDPAKVNEAKKAPYSYMARDGLIEYNGVTFVCDDEKQRICLGDVSKPGDCITIGLSEGGSLVVNRDNLGSLSKAIGMFSSEDVKRILSAMAQDKKVQEVKNEIEDDKNHIGEAEELGR